MKNSKFLDFLIALVLDEPFFASILRSLNKIETNAVPTAAVGIKDGRLTMYWNSEFFNSLSYKEILGITKHECYHVCYRHLSKKKLKGKDPLEWNFATDMSINTHIPDDELFKNFLRPGRSYDSLTEEEKLKADPAILEWIKKSPPHMTAQWYWESLQKNSDVKNAIAKSREFSGFIVDIHADGDMGKDIFDQNPDENELDEILKQILKKAIRESQENTKNWGSCSQAIKDLVLEFGQSTIAWDELLRSFLKKTISSKKRGTFKRINRKYPYIHPGKTREYDTLVHVYIDTSGSVSDEDVKSFLGELRGLLDSIEFRIHSFDTEVSKNSYFWSKNSREIEFKRDRCGGTDFSCVFSHAQNNWDKRSSGIIIMTDGCAPSPKNKLPVPTLWILSKGGTDHYIKDIGDPIGKIT